MSEEPKPQTGGGQEPPDPTKFIPKEQFEAQKSELEKLQGDLDRVKGQLLDPEYLEYLESKKNGAVRKTNASTEVKDALSSLTADEIERLPKARLLEIAEKRIGEALTEKLTKEFNAALGGLQSTVQNLIFQRELADVREKHEDFDKYEKEIQAILSRPGSSYTYEDAYILAKAQRGETSPSNNGKPAPKTEKRSSGEKPSATAPATNFEQKDFKDKNEAAAAALATVRAKYGLEGDVI